MYMEPLKTYSVTDGNQAGVNLPQQSAAQRFFSVQNYLGGAQF